MAFWNGTTWAPETVAVPQHSTSSIAGRVRPAVLLAVLALMVTTGSVFAAKGGTTSGAPTLTASFASSSAFAAASNALTVSGKGYTPSSGGQQVSLWVGYPNDYCASDFSVCHGFYYNPWV